MYRLPRFSNSFRRQHHHQHTTHSLILTSHISSTTHTRLDFRILLNSLRKSAMTDHARDWERDLQELRTREGLETAVNLHPTNIEQIRLSPQVEQYLAEQGEVRSVVKPFVLLYKLIILWVCIVCKGPLGTSYPRREAFRRLLPSNPLLHLVRPTNLSIVSIPRA